MRSVDTEGFCTPATKWTEKPHAPATQSQICRKDLAMRRRETLLATSYRLLCLQIAGNTSRCLFLRAVDQALPSGVPPLGGFYRSARRKFWLLLTTDHPSPRPLRMPLYCLTCGRGCPTSPRRFLEHEIG